MVRLSDPATALLAVDRECEVANSRRAAAVGVAPQVLGHLPGEGVLVVDYIPSRTLTDADVALDLDRVADAVRTLHGAEPFEGVFDVFELQRRYLALAREHGLEPPAGYDDLAATAARVEAALAAHRPARVSCHNDLLAANLLDDGERVRIIDFEYSGMGEAAFELGNLAQEAGLDDDALAALVHAYEPDAARAEALLDRARLFVGAAAHAWTLWGVIQAGTSTLDFDFAGWAGDKLDRAAERFADRGLDHLLDRVGAPR